MRRASAIILAGVVAAVGASFVGTSAWNDRQQRHDAAVALTGGDPARGPDLMRRYGCAGCHTIDGVPGADGQVGPPLTGLGQRVYLGGHALNTPDDLVHWITAPTDVSPGTAMPATGISADEARDVAAWLYSR